MRLILAAVIFALAASVCLASPPRRTYAYTPAKAVYVAPRTVYKAVYRDRTILIADAAFLLFDDRAKDVFAWTGPAIVSPGVPLGTDGRGLELRGFSQGQTQTLQTPQDDVRDVAGYEDGRQLRATPGPRLASLTASCASCHTGAKARGGFVLFDDKGSVAAGVNWKATREAITSGRMPLAGSNNPAPSAEDVREVDRLAGK